jgi:protein-disulfide isomerase
MIVALAGGTWIFLAVVVVLFVAIVFGYYTVTGSGISLTPWARDGEAPGAAGVGTVGKDPTVDVRLWGRGTDHRRHVPSQRAAHHVEREVDPELRARLQRWRERLGAVEGRLVADVDPQRDHVRGAPDAAVTIVMYGDLECPACRQAAGQLQRVQRGLDQPLRLVFRHFPVVDGHPNALEAAEASEAAAAQGRFWEFHDEVYGHHEPPDEDGLRRIAHKLRLDMERFEAELRANAHRPRVLEDLDSGMRSGVNGTPTLFVNGTRHDDDFDEATLRAAIQAAVVP